MATKCQDKESENCHTSISFVNNSERSLYVNYDTYYLRNIDPFNIKALSYFHPDQKNLKCCEINTNALSSNMCFEDRFKTIDTIYVFIFDTVVVENTIWEVVVQDYLVLKRYDLTLEDLQRLDWKITYPPTEAMQYVKQYPPYGSECFFQF